MSENRKQIVQSGYDAIAEKYEEWTQSVRVDERMRYEDEILTRLNEDALVLELGCGSGVPTTKRLAEKLSVTGIDLSEEQIKRARQNVPKATFLQADMTQLDFPDNHFDAVVSFYSVIHVPREQHAELFQNSYRLLKPNGLFVGALGNKASDGIEKDWLGVPMYFSHFDAETNTDLLKQAGFTSIQAKSETEEEFGDAITFLWVIAQKS